MKITLETIRKMKEDFDLPFAFFPPHQLSEDILIKVREFNQFKFLGIKNGTYETEHEYKDLDFLIMEYYSDCLYYKLISYPDFFKLLKHMIVCCPSISFAVIFSDYLSFFKGLT